MRTRFRQVLFELGLSKVSLNGKNLDLGSLRPGGATWILQTTEDSEFCRRRGRWINHRVMEIYIQEVSSFQYLSAIPPSVQQKIFCLCDYFIYALKTAGDLWRAEIPCAIWYILWQRQVTRN